MKALLLLALLFQEPVETNPGCIGCHEEADDEERGGSEHFRDGVSCIECHGPDPLHNPTGRRVHSPEFRSRTSRKKLGTLCGQCHGSELDAFSRSVHHLATMDDEADERLNSCLDCHAFHATQKADRAKIWEKCVACHEAGTWEHDEGLKFNQGMESLAAVLGRLDAKLVDLERVPGILYRDQQVTKQQLALIRQTLRIGQHSLDYANLGRESAGGIQSARLAYNKLDRKERIFSVRYFGLGGFLILIGFTGLVVYRKGRKIEESAS